MKLIKTIFAIIGVLAMLGLTIGLVADIRGIDRTTGGYDYPFDGWSGETINFSTMLQTQEGLYKSGYVVDQFFNCSTGLITWEIFGILKGEFRKFSERAIVIHKPQDECRARGFNPEAWAVSDLL